jgi:choline dehydrogenase-like flavoprotein
MVIDKKSVVVTIIEKIFICFIGIFLCCDPHFVIIAVKADNNDNLLSSLSLTSSLECLNNPWSLTYNPDYVIVGCGNSGNALAYSLLKKTTNKKILMICQGQEIPMGRNQTDNEDTYVWWYKDNESPLRTKGIKINNDYLSKEENSLLTNRGFFVPFGTNALGGLSTTNGLTYGGNGRDYWNKWGQLVGTDIANLWNWQRIKSQYRVIENFLGNDPLNQHGKNGPVTFNAIEVEKFGRTLRDAFINVTETKFLEDVNGDDVIGFGNTVRNFREIWDSSHTDSFALREDSYSTLIKPLLSNSLYKNRLVVVEQATATKFIWNRLPSNDPVINALSPLKVKGIKFYKNDKMYSVCPNSDVVITAGALTSIHLLLLNGIGPKLDLINQDIPVYVNQPLVGTNFLNQMQWLTTVMNTNPAPIESRNRGSATMGLIRSTRAILENDLLPDVMHASGRVSEKFSIIVTQQNRYKFRGSVKIQSADYHVKPIVTFGSYLASTIPNGTNPSGIADEDVIVEAFKRNRAAIAKTPGALEVGSTTAVPQGANDQTIKTWLLTNIIDGNWHIHGGNKMGKTINDGVVNSRFNVFGVGNLRVCDNSVAPIQHPGHAAASSAMYLGVICADAITQDL